MQNKRGQRVIGRSSESGGVVRKILTDLNLTLLWRCLDISLPFCANVYLPFYVKRKQGEHKLILFFKTSLQFIAAPLTTSLHPLSKIPPYVSQRGK